MPINPLNYDCLSKYPFSLAERYSIARYLASISRARNPQYWDQIKLKSAKYLKSLQILRRKGFINIQLPKPLSDNLISQLSCCTEDQFSKDIVQGQRHILKVSEFSSVLDLLNFQPLHDLASLYFQAPAFVSGTYAWWHYPSLDPRIPNSQLWHRDRDDFSQLKLFFYVTDVDSESGPHAFVPFTHNPEHFEHVFAPSEINNPLATGSKHGFLTTEQLTSLFHPDVQIQRFISPAGSCFIEDPRGFHRALSPTSKPRLIFSINWTLHPTN